MMYPMLKGLSPKEDIIKVPNEAGKYAAAFVAKGEHGN